jgi:hypothetical protein
MNEKKIKDIVSGLEGVRDAMDVLNGVLIGGPASYYYERLIDYYKGCMAAAKFKKGDRVQLREDATGWVYCKHFLVKGAVATVEEVDYYKGDYWYDLEFDDETWVDSNGVKRVPETKHTFRFSQKDLKRNK